MARRVQSHPSMPTELKYCKHCGQDKPRTEFTQLKNGWRAQCHVCQREAQKRKYHAELKHDPEFMRKSREYVNALRRKNPEPFRNRKRLSSTGWTRDDFESAWFWQEGKCFICRREMKNTGREAVSVAADHDHKTNQPRDLLCSCCNTAFGLFGESVEILDRAVNYARRWTELSLVNGA